MIQTVDSSKIDLTAARAFIAEPKATTLDQKVEIYKKEIEASTPIYKASKAETFVEPISLAIKVLELVCESLDLDQDKVKSKSRLRILVEARQIYSYIIMKVSTIHVTLSDAGSVMNKDHATVLHGVQQAINLNETNIPFSKKLDKCMGEFTKRFSGAEYYIMDFINIPQF
jgi:chromosomal replication initiation ATPase DnaA